MLSVEVKLVLYYVGFGYLVVLGWLSLAGDVLFARSDQQRRRLHTIGRALLVAGILHPALALAGRDVIRQLRMPAGEGETRIRTRSLDVAAATSVVFAAITMALMTRIDS